MSHVSKWRELSNLVSIGVHPTAPKVLRSKSNSCLHKGHLQDLRAVDRGDGPAVAHAEAGRLASWLDAVHHGALAVRALGDDAEAGRGLLGRLEGVGPVLLHLRALTSVKPIKTRAQTPKQSLRHKEVLFGWYPCWDASCRGTAKPFISFRVRLP